MSAGGTFVHHTSTTKTLQILKEMSILTPQDDTTTPEDNKDTPHFEVLEEEKKVEEKEEEKEKGKSSEFTVVDLR